MWPVQDDHGRRGRKGLSPLLSPLRWRRPTLSRPSNAGQRRPHLRVVLCDHRGRSPNGQVHTLRKHAVNVRFRYVAFIHNADPALLGRVRLQRRLSDRTSGDLYLLRIRGSCLAILFAQIIVKRRGCNCGMSNCNADLIQGVYDVSSCIDTLPGSALLCVDSDAIVVA